MQSFKPIFIVQQLLLSTKYQAFLCTVFLAIHTHDWTGMGFHLLAQGLNLATAFLALPRVGKQSNFLQEHWLCSKVVLHAWCSFEIHSNFCHFKLTKVFHFRNTKKYFGKKRNYSGGEKEYCRIMSLKGWSWVTESKIIWSLLFLFFLFFKKINSKFQYAHKT